MSMKIIKLIVMPVPKFLTSEWISYLRDCSDCIESRLFGYKLLASKLEHAGYGIGDDGTVYPF